MSKGKLLFLGLGAFLLPLLAGGAWLLLDPNWSPFGDPVYTDEIPDKAPKRPDRRLLERYAHKALPEILSALKAQTASSAPSEGSGPANAATTAFLAMLPEGPFPFPGGAKARDEAGLKQLLGRIESSSGAFPETVEERWQCLLAMAALGARSAAIPDTFRQGVRFDAENDTYGIRLVLQDSSLAGPLALGDFDGQEGLEIVTEGGTALYQLEPEGELRALEGLAGTEPGDRLYPVDFDRDGALDLYIARGGGLPDSLLRNAGDGRFVDETIERGLLVFGDTTAVVWLDYDQDGRPDLLLGYRDRPLELFRQTESGAFQPLAWELKLWVPRGVLALAAADADGNGFTDLFIAREDGRNQLLLSQPAPLWSEWRFAPTEESFTLADGVPVTCAQFFDFDRDGRSDLLLASGEAWAGSVGLFHNSGEGRYREVTTEAGLEINRPVHSLAVVDLDLDGYEDLLFGTAALTPDGVFANQGGSGFREVTVVTQGGWLGEVRQWHAIDLRVPGRIELLATLTDGQVRHLAIEGVENQWLQIAAPGAEPGTRVVVSARDRDWVLHTLQASFGEEGVLTLGLGGAESIERLEFYEAAGAEPFHQLEGVRPNQRLLLELPSRPASPPAAAASPAE